jgi:hypothetical protein
MWLMVEMVVLVIQNLLKKKFVLVVDDFGLDELVYKK